MKESSKFYWSSLAKYEQCPQMFLWSCGWEDIDVGFGPGKRKEVHSDRSHAVMGQVIQSTLEDFYNTTLWANYENDREMLKRVLGRSTRNWLAQYIRKDLLGQKVPLRVDIKEMLDTCKAGVKGYLHTIEKAGLWGVPALAEFDMSATYEGVTFAGRADFLFEPQHGGMVLDGKNTKDKKSVDADQLIWYGFLYQSRYKAMPKLGFVWYRFPADTTPHEAGITWVKAHPDDFTRLQQRAKKVHLRMIDRDFKATPSPNACRWCDHRHECNERHSDVIETFQDGPTGLDGVPL